MRPQVYGVMVELLPRKEGEEPRVVMHSELFQERGKAQDYRDEARRQNLPFKRTWLVMFADPREVDGRDSDPHKEGIFQNHNCWACDDGARPCRKGNPNTCDNPHARND